MNKILFAAFSLLSLLFITACSNDDIVIDKIAPKHTLTYKVSTQGMYDDFGVADNIRENYLRDQDYILGVFTYVYGSNGDLASSQVTTSTNFGTVEQTFEGLSEDVYNIITIETLVDPSTILPDDWRFENTDKISTIQIKRLSDETYRSSILGVHKELNFNLNGDKSSNVTPQGIGSIVNFRCYNFDTSDYVNLGFGTIDGAEIYRLDPSLQPKDRYVGNLTGSGYFQLRSKITTAKASEGYYMPTYILDNEITWTMGGQNQSQSSGTTWSLMDNYYQATIEDGGIYEAGFYYINGQIAYCFGDDYDEFISWRDYWNDYVAGASSSTVFAEPYLVWGGTVSAVKSYMSGYQAGNDGNPIAMDDGSYVLWYSGKNKEAEIDYYFTSATSGLNEVVVFFESSKVTLDGLNSDFSGKGYTYVTYIEDADAYAYVTSDEKSYVYIMKNTEDYWMVLYLSATSTRGVNDVDLNVIKNSVCKHPDTRSGKAIRGIGKLKTVE